jgi:hypothetical protein
MLLLYNYDLFDDLYWLLHTSVTHVSKNSRRRHSTSGGVPNRKYSKNLIVNCDWQSATSINVINTHTIPDVCQ